MSSAVSFKFVFIYEYTTRFWEHNWIYESLRTVPYFDLGRFTQWQAVQSWIKLRNGDSVISQDS
ncbi:hypothetical protein Cflav_PD3909 [Pedosphaera parvula Ellin514]|uniref:Uncharacterized protein n=1 Tax=Pedosphaera parvula (strain Ellin514) TaxID=320771 RepID=B9XG30_PEDPL|nr:hypothetical protein Cflav_PD3909 [Pedosphaera parvula Ellin514]